MKSKGYVPESKLDMWHLLTAVTTVGFIKVGLHLEEIWDVVWHHMMVDSSYRPNPKQCRSPFFLCNNHISRKVWLNLVKNKKHIHNHKFLPKGNTVKTSHFLTPACETLSVHVLPCSNACNAERIKQTPAELLDQPLRKPWRNTHKLSHTHFRKVGQKKLWFIMN